jgi:hypothetical protein
MWRGCALWISQGATQDGGADLPPSGAASADRRSLGGGGQVGPLSAGLKLGRSVLPREAKILNLAFAFTERESHGRACKLLQRLRALPFVWIEIGRGSEQILAGS